RTVELKEIPIADELAHPALMQRADVALVARPEGWDVQPTRIVHAPLRIADSDDLRADLVQNPPRVHADVPEALDRHRRFRKIQFQVLHRFQDHVSAPWSGCGLAAQPPTERQSLARENAGHGVAALLPARAPHPGQPLP